MAFTKVRGRGVTTTDNYTVGVITATKFVGPITGNGGGIQVGLLTATGLDVNGDADISGNLTVGGDFTTLNTTLREVELLHVDANDNTATAGIITQRGSGDILNLFDNNTEVLTVKDGGKIGIGTANPSTILHLRDDSNDCDLTVQATASGKDARINLYGHSGGVSQIRLGDEADENVGLITYDHSSNSLQLRAGDNERLRIESSGAARLKSEYLRFWAAAQTSSDFSQKVGLKWTYETDATTVAKIEVSRPSWSGGPSDILFHTTNTSGNLLERLGILNDGSVRVKSNPFRLWAAAHTSSDFSQRVGLEWTYETGTTTVAKIDVSRPSWSGGPSDMVFHTTNTSGTFAEKLRITSGGRVGIGTVNPVEVLHVLQSGTTAAEFRLENSEGYILLRSDNNLATYDAQSHIFRSRDGSDEYGKFNSDGEFGIGTNSPDQLLHIATSGDGPFIRLQNTDVTIAGGQTFGGIEFESTDSSSNCLGIIAKIQSLATGTFDGTSANGGALTFHTSQTNPVSLQERLRITPAGKVGIGENNPTYHTEIKMSSTDAYSQSTLNSGQHQLRVNNAGASGVAGILLTAEPSSGSAGHAGIRVIAPANGSADMTFSTRSAGTYGERLRITAAGNLKLPDSAKIEFGGAQTGSGNMNMVFDGSNAAIELQTGNFSIIAYDNNKDVKILSDNGSGGVANYFVADGSTGETLLHHYGSQKFATSTTGITVTGEVAASQDYPNYRPTLDLNFAAVKKLDSRITYYRTGPASYTDENGLVKLVGDNTPRFDHDPVTKECKGLLIEESRINRFASSDAAHSGWIAGGGITRTANTTDTKDPAGTYTATKFMSEASANSGSQIYDGMSRSSGGVQSLWAKKGTHNVLGIYDYSGGSGIRAWYDLNTGEHRCEGGSKVAAGLQSEGNDNNDSWMIEYPNGWYRCIYYEAANMTYAHFRICDFDSDGEASSSSNSIYVWGLQAEDGDVKFATSHIPCNTGYMPGTITRGADIVLLDDIENEMGYNQSEGTAVIEYNYTEDTDGAHSLFAFSGTEADPDNGSPRQWLRINKTVGTARAIRYSMTNGGTSNSTDSSAVATPGQWDKFAFAYEAGDQDLSFNGSSILDDAETPATNHFRLALGNIGWSLGLETTSLEGHIRRFMYYPKKLPNSQLNTLTS